MPPSATPSDIDLTPRELACLGELARGLRQDAIASALGITVATVELHLTNARRKLGAHTSTQAVAIAITRGLVAI